MNEKKVVAIYLRRATDNEKRNVEEQEEKIRQFCRLKGYTIYKVYTDIGYSGNNYDRPSYQQMMLDMRATNFNLIVAYNISTISRNIISFEDFFNEVKNNNCSIKILNDKIDTSDSRGTSSLIMLFATAKLEAGRIRRGLPPLKVGVNNG